MKMFVQNYVIQIIWPMLTAFLVIYQANYYINTLLYIVLTFMVHFWEYKKNSKLILQMITNICNLLPFLMQTIINYFILFP